jgi:NitT/TauT family transport system substrate-binding protein
LPSQVSSGSRSPGNERLKKRTKRDINQPGERGSVVMRKAFGRLTLLCLAGLLTATGLAFGATTASRTTQRAALTNVSLRLDWLYGAEHAAYFVAQAKGYFKDAGLNVKIEQGNGSTVSAKLVGNGSDTFGVCSAGTVLASVNQHLPIESVATLFQNVPSGIVSPMSKKITSLTQLDGKTLGVDPSSDDYNAWHAVAALNHIDLSKIHEVSITGDASAELAAGKVDAIVGWTFNEALETTLKGVPTYTLKFQNLGLHVPGSSIIANTSMIKKDPQTVRAFVGAVLKGWAYTIAHPSQALAIFLKAQPSVDKKYNTDKLPLVLIQVKPPAGAKVGQGTASNWQQLEGIYLKAKIIKSSIPLSKVFTNQFLA